MKAIRAGIQAVTIVFLTLYSFTSLGQIQDDDVCIPPELKQNVLQCPETEHSDTIDFTDVVDTGEHLSSSLIRQELESYATCTESCRYKPNHCNSLDCLRSYGLINNNCRMKCMLSFDEPEILESRSLTAEDQKVLQMLSSKACFEKTSEKSTEMKFRRGQILFEANRFAEAAVVFEDIAVNQSADHYGVKAARRYMDSLYFEGTQGADSNPNCLDDLSDFVNLVFDSTKPPGKVLMRDETFSKEIRTLKVDILIKRAEGLSKREQFAEAAEIYLGIANDFSDFYPEEAMCAVIFNAAINLDAGRLLLKANEARQKLLNEHPHCPLSQTARYDTAANYNALQMHKEAADNYLLFAKEKPHFKEASKALQTAITFYIGVGRHKDAFEGARLFEKLFDRTKPKDTATVFFSIGYIHINKARTSNSPRHWQKVREHYTRYLKKYGKLDLSEEIIQSHVFIGDSHRLGKKPNLERAYDNYQTALRIFDNNSMDKVEQHVRKARMLIAAAKARYHLAEKEVVAFFSLPFPEFSPRWNAAKQTDTGLKQKRPPKIFATEADFLDSFEHPMEDISETLAATIRSWHCSGDDDHQQKECRTSTSRIKSSRAQVRFEYWIENDFKHWIEESTLLIEKANSSLARVVDMHVPEWEIAAVTKAGDMQLHIGRALINAPVPPSIADEDELVRTYQKILQDKAMPLVDSGKSLYKHCQHVSTVVQQFNEVSVHCEAQLNKLDPEQYPLMKEFIPSPSNDLTNWAIPGIIEKAPPTPLTALSDAK